SIFWRSRSISRRVWALTSVFTVTKTTKPKPTATAIFFKLDNALMSFTPQCHETTVRRTDTSATSVPAEFDLKSTGSIDAFVSNDESVYDMSLLDDQEPREKKDG